MMTLKDSLKHLIILDVSTIIIVQVTKSIMSSIKLCVARDTVNTVRFWPLWHVFHLFKYFILTLLAPSYGKSHLIKQLYSMSVPICLTSLSFYSFQVTKRRVRNEKPKGMLLALPYTVQKLK